MAYMLATDVSDAFRRRGWIRGAGGDLYFDGHGGAAHPHLHLRINGRNTVNTRRREIRMAVTMLAWSAGGRVGGTTYIRGAEVIRPNWEHDAVRHHMNPAMWAEFEWIMDYFTRG